MKYPNGELVAKAWILGISGVPSGGVATTLPEDREAWPNGFVQLSALEGSPLMYALKHESLLDVACWAPPAEPGSDKPRWNMAAQLAHSIVQGCLLDDFLAIQRTLTLPSAYDNGRVLTAIPTDPERRGADENSNACYGFELTLTWIKVPK